MSETDFSRIMLPLCGVGLLGMLIYATTRLAQTTKMRAEGSKFFIYFGLLIGAGLAIGLGVLVLFFRHKVGGGGI